MTLDLAQTQSGKTLGPLPSLVNRHGLIAGATGTGKTVTLQRFAEQMSELGVPVFMVDVKGDLAGIAASSSAPNPKVIERLTFLGRKDVESRSFPVMFWDLNGKKGHPVRTTPTEFGPALLARVLELNETQTSVLQILFKIADDGGLLLLDMKDLLALLSFAQENIMRLKTQYGHLAPATLGSIQRALLAFSTQGDQFFGEPALSIQDFLQNAPDGRGYINVLAADEVFRDPKVYSSFLIWLLSEVFEELPEVGDLEKPKLALFFDEAHLLFFNTSKTLTESIETSIRLIRSKGVGVYFVTQNPTDLPPTVLSQLGNRVQHALRSFTPQDEKAVRMAATTMRPNPAFKAEEVITQLGVGEALVSFLDEKGSPLPVERAFIVPPQSRIGPLTDAERRQIVASSPAGDAYTKVIDRESAAEILKKRAGEKTGSSDEATASTAAPGNSAKSEAATLVGELLFGSTGPRGGRREGLVEKAATSAARNIAGTLGRELVRGLLGGLTGGSRRRR